MAFDGNGNWISNFSAEADKAAGYKILASRFDNIFIADIAQSFENCLTKDAQVKPTTNFDVNNHRIINMSDPVNNLDAVNKQTLVSSDALCVHLAGTETITGDKTASGDWTFSGDVDVPTQTSTDDSTKAASTAFVQNVASSYAYGAAPRDVTELADEGMTALRGNGWLNLSESWQNFEELVIVAPSNSPSFAKLTPFRVSTYWLNYCLSQPKGSPVIWSNYGDGYLTASNYNDTSNPSTANDLYVNGHAYCYLGKVLGINRKSTP